MKPWTVLLAKSAKADLKKLKASHLHHRFIELCETLASDPFAPSDRFEKLQPRSEGYYSRRINHQHRMVYQVDAEMRVVTIYATWSHYQ